MGKEFKVWCQTDDELAEVLTRLGRDGFTWASGHNPIDCKHVSLGAPVGIITFKGHIYYCQSRFDFDDIYTSDVDEISVEYYIKNGRPADSANNKTVELEKGKLLSMFRTIISSNDSLNKLLKEAPEVGMAFELMILLLEGELFKE